MTLKSPSQCYLDDIEIKGYAVIEDAFDSTFINALLDDCHRINPKFKLAGIGRQQNLQVDKSIQGLSSWNCFCNGPTNFMSKISNSVIFGCPEHEINFSIKEPGLNKAALNISVQNKD